MTDTPAFDAEAAYQAVVGGKSVAEHFGISADTARIPYAEAVAQFATRQFDEAIRSLAMVIRLDPRHADAWALLGNCFKAEGRFEAALGAWQMAMTLRPDRASVTLVARTAIALSDLAAAGEAMIMLPRYIRTDEHLAEYLALTEALKNRMPA